MRAGPSLLLTAHFGNWEAQAAAWRRLGVALLGAARPIRSATVAAWVARIRARHDISVIHSSVPRSALRHLRAGGCFGLLWDQHSPSGMQDGRLGNFLGARAALDPLPFFLLERNPCPVYFGVLLPGGALRLIPLLDPTQSGSHAGRQDWEKLLARRYHRVLATLVRARPELWHGVLHARFKAMGAYPGHRDGVG
ncbi:MAG TPA: lysophospholipid acyltransferase family protein [Fibrobacteria bacterium]|jgi:lauroyl/myristoyl acyltransferase|nr:lysophospholipid acyltransferase family protein [Fibrobacteria bacterium]